MAFETLLQVQGALDSGVPTHLSYGFVSGYCSGMALKKVGKAVSVVLGTYCSLQHESVEDSIHRSNLHQKMSNVSFMRCPGRLC